MKNTEKKTVSLIKRMFMDDNGINEKSVVGFASFIMMVICLAVDIWTGFHGQQMPINEFIFVGFMVITLGSFWIDSVDKYINTRKESNNDSENTTIE